jgi:hypothetical protein
MRLPMDDRHMVPLETTEGARTAASGSERVLIGLALLALFGAVLIIVSNLVGVDLEASASGSPKPSIHATATPRPTRSPAPRRQLILEPGEPSSPAEEPSFGIPEPNYQSYWIRAEEDLPVRGSPSLDSETSFTIPAGAAAMVNDAGSFGDGLDWVALQVPHGGYWVATRADGRDLATRYRQEPAVQSGWIAGLAAGPGGFVATGREAGPWDQPLDVVIASPDGAAWSGTGDWVRSSGSAQGSSVTSAAWGPAGWLVITSSYDRQSFSTWIHRSEDGVAWETLGSIPSRYGESLAGASVVASEFGYVLASGWGNPGPIWFSTDGVAWREMGNLTGTRGHSTTVTAIPDGFLAWSYADRNGPRNLVGAAFSIDGRDWTEVTGGPTGEPPRVAAVGDRVIGMDTDPADGAARVWVGSISRGILTWRRVPGADAAFAGGLVTALTSDGVRAYAFGFDRGPEHPVVWAGDGIRWTREALPAQFEGVPSAAAAGATGVVVVGSRPTMRGDNPIFWHRTQGGDWQPERSPVFEVAQDRPRDCGSAPTDLFELSALDRISVIACFGDAPISFRAWSAPCDWCGQDPGQDLNPAWLGYGMSNQLIFSLLGDRDGSDYPILDAHLPPSLALQPEWVGAWIEVTGHFDDPAALTCTYDAPDVPDALNGWWYYSGAWVVNDCRQRFVIDAVAVVEGP